MTAAKLKVERNIERTKELRKKKLDLRETFYGALCDYEIEQTLIKDIEWIQRTKEMVVERAQRNERYKQEKQQRNEERKRIQAEREKRQAEQKARQEERRLE